MEKYRVNIDSDSYFEVDSILLQKSARVVNIRSIRGSIGGEVFDDKDIHLKRLIKFYCQTADNIELINILSREYNGWNWFEAYDESYNTNRSYTREELMDPSRTTSSEVEGDPHTSQIVDLRRFLSTVRAKRGDKLLPTALYEHLHKGLVQGRKIDIAEVSYIPVWYINGATNDSRCELFCCFEILIHLLAKRFVEFKAKLLQLASSDIQLAKAKNRSVEKQTRLSRRQLEMEIEKLKRERDQAEDQLLNAEIEREEIRDELKDMKAKMDRVLAQNEHTHRKLKQAKADRNQIQEKLVQATNQRNQIQEKLVQANDQLADTNAQLTNVNAQLVSTRATLNHVCDSVAVIANKMDAAKTYLDEHVNEKNMTLNHIHEKLVIFEFDGLKEQRPQRQGYTIYDIFAGNPKYMLSSLKGRKYPISEIDIEIPVAEIETADGKDLLNYIRDNMRRSIGTITSDSKLVTRDVFAVEKFIRRCVEILAPAHKSVVVRTMDDIYKSLVDLTEEEIDRNAKPGS